MRVTAGKKGEMLSYAISDKNWTENHLWSDESKRVRLFNSAICMKEVKQN